MSVSRTSVAICLAMAAASVATPLVAQGAGEGAPPEIFGALTKCRAISDDAARLACFDETSAKLADAAEKKEIVVLDRAEVKKTKRSLFGFSLPKLPFLEGDKDEDEPEFQQISSTIDTAKSLGYGKWSIRIAEGALWQTTEAYRGTPKHGDAITIKKGTMGGYFMSIDDKRSVRAMRVN